MAQESHDLFDQVEDVVAPRENISDARGNAQRVWWRWFWNFRSVVNQNFQGAGVSDNSSNFDGRLTALEEAIRDLVNRNQVLEQVIADQQVALAAVGVSRTQDLLPLADFRQRLENIEEVVGSPAAVCAPADQIGASPATLAASADQFSTAPALETGHLAVRDAQERFATVTATKNTSLSGVNSVILAGSPTGVPVSLSATAGSTDANVGIAIVPKGTGAVTTAIPDNGVTGGNARGTNAIDLQTIRTAATQVASGAISVVVGANSTATQSGAVAIGSTNSATAIAAISIGNNNSAAGVGSIVNGVRGTDRTTNYSRVFSANRIAADGDKQIQECLFNATTTGAAAVRLTTDGAAAASNNVMVLPDNSAYLIECLFVAHDKTTNKNLVYWRAPGLIERGTGAATTALGSTPPAFVLQDNTATPPTLAAAPTIAADTTLGGLNISVTPPAGNTDTWRFVCYVRAIQTI